MKRGWALLRRLSRYPSNPVDAKTASKPKKVGPVGPPSPIFVRRLASLLKEWHNHHENWINSWRHKSITDEVKCDVDELEDSIKQLHQKLDATLLGLNLPLLVKPDVTPDHFVIRIGRARHLAISPSGTTRPRQPKD